jgi:hypothetical protein
MFEPLAPIIPIEYWLHKFGPRHRKFCSCFLNGKNTLVCMTKFECTNGVLQYKMYCWECGSKGPNIRHSLLSGIDENSIPLFESYNIFPCERCGDLFGSEEHHWAPRHLFEDADLWPTSWLCRECHALWHSIVTPNMGITT